MSEDTFPRSEIQATGAMSPSQLQDLFQGAVGSVPSSSVRPSPQVSIKIISMKGET